MLTTPILLIEDEENDVFLFKRAMEKEGVMNRLLVANDGQAAIDYLQGAGPFVNREKFPLPGLILLDLKLPFVMGLDVLKWIRQQSDSTIVVLILSASRDEEDIASAYRLGANAYLVKPTELSQLGVMVGSIKGFWLMQNMPPPNSAAELGLQKPRPQTLPATRSLHVTHSPTQPLHQSPKPRYEYD